MLYSLSYGQWCSHTCGSCENYGGVCRLVRFVNLTPHAVSVRTTADGGVTIPPSGQVARVSTREEVVNAEFPFQVVKRVWGEVEGLPAPQPGQIYIVSALVLDRCRGRDDVFAPDTGPTAVRDNNGRIIAVTRLVAA